MEIEAVVNGVAMTLQCSMGTNLLCALRDAGVLSPKTACEEGRCGACSVLNDGAVVYSCLLPALACHGAAITTVEAGVAADLTEALVARGAVQCGFCTPGFVVTIEALLARYAARPLDDATVRAALSGNLCRCTGYEGLVAATLDVHLERTTVSS